MSEEILAQLMICLLLIVSELRPFIISNKVISPEKDALSVLPFAALVISIIMIFSFGLSLISILLVLLSLILFLINIRQFSSLLSGLSGTSFSPLFSGFSIFMFILTLLVFAAICFSIPFSMTAKDSRKSVQKYSELLKGNLIQGYEKTYNPFAKDIIKVTCYYPENSDELPLCIFIADEYINTHYAQPLLTSLAKKGLKVAAFEFSDSHRLYAKAFLNRLALYNNPDYCAGTEEIHINQAKSALLALKSPDKVFVLADGSFKDCWKKLEEDYTRMIASVYEINSEEEEIYGYKDGFANFIQLNPLECLFLKIKPCRDKLMNELIASKAVKKFGIQKKEDTSPIQDESSEEIMEAEENDTESN